MWGNVDNLKTKPRNRQIFQAETAKNGAVDYPRFFGGIPCGVFVDLLRKPRFFSIFPICSALALSAKSFENFPKN